MSIEVRELQVAYEDQIILSDISLRIPKGKVTTIIGKNGCGKSTLLKTAARILLPRKGKVYLNGRDIRKMVPKEVAKTMAVLPQSPSAPAGLLVEELVSYGRFPYQKPMRGLGEHDRQVVKRAMEETGILDLKNRTLEELSGGQRQRAWIALALAQETDTLLLDEPTTYLDMAHQLEILNLLKKLNREQNTTVIMVIHELNQAAKYADHIIGMKEGKMIFEGSPSEVVTVENLRRLYEIEARLQFSQEGGYPVCTDYELTS